MDEISEVISMPGEKMPKLIISVLETFGCVMKVNAFNFVNVVDALYYSKYFLTLTAVKCQHPKAYSVVKTVGTLVSSERDTEVKSFTVFLRIMCANITVVGDGRINEAVYKGLRRRVIGIAMQNPGILESCRK
ncbi:uncharacterized protein LOC115704671 isoform X3 [Cannabis sativa]|uniref:uncharacterized protein LOC115704671 isoform X3 n=1 Tax=Cannabis sativa TaxID=3483 RepID=UPI0029CA56C2|nr:uncharacterized protein LOC115704671 isoform X3 [Cannabis sativa]